MKKNLRFSIIWLIALAIVFVPLMIASNTYQKWINIAEDELFAIYQDYMPLSSAHIESIEAYTFHREIDQVKSKVGDHFRLFFVEAASKDAENARKFIPFFGISLLLLVGLGFVALLVFLILGTTRSIKTKQIDARYFKPSLILFVGIVTVMGIFSYQESLESKTWFSESNKIYDIAEYSTNTVYKFIELINVFYEISVIEETQEEYGWLSKIMLAKKKNETLLNELEAIKKWTVLKDTYFPKYEDIVLPAIEICKWLNRYFELVTDVPSSAAEKEKIRAEGYAEFSELLEKLPGALKGAVKYNGVFMKDILEANQFDKDTLAKFQLMDNDPADTKYNVKLLFGYTVYREIKKKAEAEEAYAKKAVLLESK